METSQYTACNRILDWVMLKVKGTQMEREEYAYISSFLGGKNFLVFGTGYDSDYWRCVNKDGHTIFLEDDPEWIDDTKSDILQITYTSKRHQHKKLLKDFINNQTKRLAIPLPKEVKNSKWDLIFVDAPVGNSDDAPGRMQSIYAAYCLASPDTHVFVHDCDREVENIYTYTMFTKIKELKKLRHLRKETK